MIRNRTRARSFSASAPIPWYLSNNAKVSDTSPSFWTDFVNDRYATNSTEQVLSDIATFSRASSQTYFDANGVMQTATSDTVALGHDPLTGSKLGYQTFGASTNLATYSEDFTQSSMWVTARVTLTSGVTAPDGVTASTKFAPTAVLGSHEITQASNPITSGVAYTHSLIVKPDFYSRLFCEPYPGRYGTGSGSYYFDLKKGTVTVNVTATGVYDHGIIPLGGGWYRVYICMTASATSADGRVWFGILDNSNNKSFTGNGTDGLYIASYEIQTGQKELTPYIKTTGTSLTRAADVLLSSASDTVAFADWWDTTKGTIMVDFLAESKGTTDNRGIYSVNNGTITYYFDNSFADNSGDLKVASIYNGSTQLSQTFNYYQTLIKSRIVMGWETNNAIAASDGLLGTLDTTVNPSALVNQLQFGVQRQGTPLNGYIQELRYYPVRATDTEIKDLSNRFSMADSLRNATSAVAFGDSITQSSGTFGMGTLQYPTILGTALGITVTNSGVSGTPMQNTNDASGFPASDNGRDRYVSALTGGAKKDVCIIMYGTNDLGKTTVNTLWSLGNFINDYQEVITGLIGAGYAADDIILCSPPYIKTYNWDATFTGSNQTIHEQYVAAVKQLATDNGCLYAATYEATKAIGDDTSFDGLHLNARAHIIIAEEIMKAKLV